MRSVTRDHSGLALTRDETETNSHGDADNGAMRPLDLGTC